MKSCCRNAADVTAEKWGSTSFVANLTLAGKKLTEDYDKQAIIAPEGAATRALAGARLFLSAQRRTLKPQRPGDASNPKLSSRRMQPKYTIAVTAASRNIRPGKPARFLEGRAEKKPVRFEGHFSPKF